MKMQFQKRSPRLRVRVSDNQFFLVGFQNHLGVFALRAAVLKGWPFCQHAKFPGGAVRPERAVQHCLTMDFVLDNPQPCVPVTLWRHV